MKNKILFVVFLLMASVSARAYDFEKDGLYYNILNNSPYTVEITRQYKSYDWRSEDNYSNLTSANIPETVLYDGKSYSVIGIGEEAFDGSKNLSSVIIPESVLSIGDWAFFNCEALSSISISKSVKSIGKYAFGNCCSLTSIDIPNSVTSIGLYAFSNSGLTSVSVPNSATSIGRWAFEDCENLASAVIPNTITDLDGLFENCHSLTSITLPDSITCISWRAFMATGLVSFSIPNTVTIVDGEAFANCNNLTAITIPNSVTSIGYAAFVGCRSLKSVIIPQSVINIDLDAFKGCDSLTIYCEVSSRPEGWDVDWNPNNRPVVWKTSTPVTEKATNAVNIYAYGKTIVVENAAEEIRVYDAMGRLVCRDAVRHVSTITVNGTGVYIVKVGDVVKRVVIN